jgi:hypothetical protein
VNYMRRRWLEVSLGAGDEWTTSLYCSMTPSQAAAGRTVRRRDRASDTDEVFQGDGSGQVSRRGAARLAPL